ncbi:MAG: glycosyl transferase family 1 [Gemmatales bacterium]|nr:MAG: glycosyl transferase family 1 [Gemmatales bacterium]
MYGSFPTIGFDARLWHWTGIGRYIRNILPLLKGVELVVWCLPEDASEVRARLPHATIRECNIRPFTLKEWLFWPAELNHVPLDLFHAPHINIPVFCRVPLVVTLHDVIPLRYREAINSKLGRQYFAMMSSLAVARAVRIIAVSQTTRQDLISILQADPNKIRVIGEAADPHFGVPVEPFEQLTLRERFGIHGPYVLYSGQWKCHKNLDLLLHAFAGLRQRHPDIQLVLVGRRDATQTHVPNLIRKLQLQQAVVCTGYIRDEHVLAALYQGAAVLAHPSCYEGFGLPPLEAMAAGVPVVASNAASLPEVVGHAGLLLPPDDVGQWIDALDSAIHDEHLRDRLIGAGFQRVRQLTWNRAARSTLDVYQEILTAQSLSQRTRHLAFRN